jgi:hypothetical protein
VGNSAIWVTEFTGRQAIHHSGLDRQGHHFSAADLPRSFILCILPIAEEVQGALLMNNVKQRATHDHKDHDDGVRLHEGGWYGRRKLGEGISGEH